MKKFSNLSLLLCLPLMAGLVSCEKNETKNNEEPAQHETHTHSFVMRSSPSAHWEECSCGEVTMKEEHKYDLKSEVPANCKEGKISHYECSECHYENVVEGTERVAHKFTKTLIKDATCQEKGVYKYHCSECDEEYTEEFENKNAHHFDAGNTESGITTYRCEVPNCTHSYQVISAKEKEVATVDSENLASAGAIELKEATIALDESILSSLENEVTIGAEKKTVEDLPEETSEETLNLVKNAPIFDFSMKNGDEDVHQLNGKVQITIPYELKEGEDPKNVSVAYINNEGEVEYFRTDCSKGNILFETDHFSLYAVVQLSPDEACAKFGHTRMQIKETDSTCIKPGIVVDACTRCGEQFVTEKELAEHHFVLQGTVPATYTTTGKINYVCSACGEIKVEETPMLIREGDNYVMTFAKSILKSNIHLSGVAKGIDNNGEESTIDIYFAPNYKEPFIVTDSGTSQEAIIGGYSYTYPYARISSSNVLETIAQISSRLENTPETFTTLTDVIEQVLDKVLITKTNRDGKTVLTLDFDKIEALISKAKTSNIIDLLKYILGEETFQKIYSVIDNFYEKTIKESLDALKDFGINVEEVMDFISYFMGPTSDETSLYDSIFTPELLSATGAELGLIPGPSGEEPMSKEEFKNLLKSLEDVTVTDMLGGMASIDIFEMVEGYVDFFKKAITAEIITSTNGQFESAKLTLDFPEENPFGAPAMNMTIEASTKCDAESGHMKAVKILNKTFNVQKQLSMGNYIAELEKYFSKQYPGIKFSFTSDNNRPSYESNYINVKFDGSGEKKTVKAKIRLEIAFGRELWYNSFEDSHNIYGKKNAGLMASVSSYSFFDDCYIDYYDEYYNVFYSEYISLGDLSLIYDPTTDSLFLGRAYGHIYEFDKPEVEDHMFHYEAHCVICGQTSTWGGSTSHFGYEGEFFLQGMNAEALRYNYRMYNYVPYQADMYMNLCLIEVSELANGGNNLINHQKGIDKTYNFGNVTIEFTYSNDTHSCRMNENIKFYVDSKLVLDLNNMIHTPLNVDGPNANATLTKTLIGEEGCYKYYLTEVTCKDCGEVVYQQIETVTHHDNQIVETYNGNEFYLGYKVYQCTNCGEIQIETNGDLHQHDIDYDYDNNRYYCNDCEEYLASYRHFGFQEFNLEPSQYSSFPQQLDRDNNYYIVARDFTYCYPDVYFESNMVTIGLYDDETESFLAQLDIDYINIYMNFSSYSLLGISKQELEQFLIDNNCTMDDLKIAVVVDGSTALIYDMPSLEL